MAKHHQRGTKQNSTMLTFREELTVEDGIALKGTCIVTPHKKHQAMLHLIIIIIIIIIMIIIIIIN